MASNLALQSQIQNLIHTIQAQPLRHDLWDQLGQLYAQSKDYESAKICFQQALKQSSDCVDYRAHLGVAHYHLGEFVDALNHFYDAAKQQPKTEYIVNITEILKKIRIKEFHAAYRDMVILILRNQDVDPQPMTMFWQEVFALDPLFTPLRPLLNAKDYDDFKNSFESNQDQIFELLANEFIQHGLKKLIIIDIKLERMLMNLRRYFLFSKIPDVAIPVIQAMAAHYFYNEYVALVREAEKQAYQNLSFDNVADLLIYACYAPLSSIAESQKVTKWTKDTIAKPIIQIQYQDYQKEKMLIQSIPSFSKVDNKISQKVRVQYEENPYPRWQVAHNLSGKKIHITPAGKRTGRYLIAGCGTGRLSVQIGFTATDMDIDCIDLSFASLGYAKRKAQEYGLSHLHFKQGDLLDIAALQHKYDVINCAGVLHHMDDPVAGWRALVNVMNPKGRMMIALYSRQARQHIKMAQEMIKEKGYGDTADDIRAFRHDLMALSADHPLRTLTHVRDFYTLSNCRDLLFHVQETWYDLPEIAKIAEDLGLVFTGFKLQDPSYGIQYQKEFPDDPEMLNLDNWHRFEQKNPHIFVSMYQMNFTQKGVF